MALHDASNIAAVIVEPIAGSTGVLIPPRGYLERLREICDRHGILLIFDEVITGFGRTGAPFAAQEFGVTPDMITLAKGLTNGCVPMGAVLVSKAVYDAFMQGPDGIELFHGYTYSAHPAACAAGLATLGIYEREGLLTRAKSLAQYWEDGAHALRGLPHVIDVRNYGLIWDWSWRPFPASPGRAASRCSSSASSAACWSARRRHHRAVAAAHHRAGADRPDLRDVERGAARAVAARAARRPQARIASGADERLSVRRVTIAADA